MAQKKKNGREKEMKRNVNDIASKCSAQTWF
jgi:hypothetical protein